MLVSSEKQNQSAPLKIQAILCVPSLHGCLLVVISKVWIGAVLQEDSCDIDVVLGSSVQPIV